MAYIHYSILLHVFLFSQTFTLGKVTFALRCSMNSLRFKKVAEASARHAAVSAGNPRIREANQEVETEHYATPAQKASRLQRWALWSLEVLKKIVWANYNDVSRGHPKWWFSKGTSPKSP